MFGLFGGAKPQVQKISHEEAKRIMQEEKDVLVVDVRTPGEYRGGHIPGAINIPNETIAKKEPEGSTHGYPRADWRCRRFHSLTARRSWM